MSNIRQTKRANGELLDDPAPLTWASAIIALRSGELGPFLDARLATSPHQKALFWETPPLSASRLSLPFEFATLPAPHLTHAQSDGSAFAAHFRAAASHMVATFTNVGGDATLVCPCPPRTGGASRHVEDSLHAPSHAHLAAFVQFADPSQRDALWRAVGEAAEHAARRTSLTWISTAGSGVPWLHVRLDSRPKYYKHIPYTSP